VSGLILYCYCSVGVGASEPLLFSSVIEGDTRRSAASEFFHLMVLQTWNIVHIEQSQAYGDINITRTPNFAQAVQDHLGN
jgi:hypothetical protein